MVNQTSTTLGQFLDDWLAGQKQRLKEATWNSYSVAVERIRNGLGKRKLLQALTPLQIERFYLQLAEAGGRTGRPLAAKTIRNTHVVLGRALDDAERLGLVQRNAAAVARPPVAHRTEQQTWSADNFRMFFAHAADDRLYAVYVLLGYHRDAPGGGVGPAVVGSGPRARAARRGQHAHHGELPPHPVHPEDEASGAGGSSTSIRRRST